MGYVQMAGQRAAGGLRPVVAAQRPREIGVGFGRQAEPGGPERERGRDQRGQEELEEGDHASAPT